MKKYLIPEGGSFYKANLHTHTTVSDGKLTPEEIKEEYKKRGYSIVAYTDHRLMIPHPELADDDFLPITAMEIDINDETRWKKFQKTFHINVYSPDINRSVTAAFSEKLALTKEHMAAMITDDMRAHGVYEHTYEKGYVQDLINKVLAEG